MVIKSPDSSDNDKHFDQEWGEDAPHGMWWAMQERYAHLFPYMVQIKNKRVIDFGCGDGSFLHALRLMGSSDELVGIETSDVGREKTRQKLSKFNDSNFKVVRSLNELDAINTPTIAIALHVFEHLEKPHEYLNDLMLKSDMILVEVPIEGGFFIRRKMKKLERLNGGKNPWGHVNFWSIKNFFEFLKSHNYIVLDHKEYAPILYGNTNPYDLSLFSIKRSVKSIAWNLLPKSIFRMIYSTFLFVCITKK